MTEGIKQFMDRVYGVERVELIDSDGFKVLRCYGHDGSWTVADGQAVLPLEGQRRDYAEWGESRIDDTIRLRVLDWRFTFQDYCTDDTRPLDFIGLFHPGRFPVRDRRYHRDPLGYDGLHWPEIVVNRVMCAGPAEVVRAYVNRLPEALREYVNDKFYGPTEPEVSKRIEDLRYDTNILIAWATARLPKKRKLVVLLNALDETGFDYLDLGE